MFNLLGRDYFCNVEKIEITEFGKKHLTTHPDFDAALQRLKNILSLRSLTLEITENDHEEESYAALSNLSRLEEINILLNTNSLQVDVVKHLKVIPNLKGFCVNYHSDKLAVKPGIRSLNLELLNDLPQIEELEIYAFESDTVKIIGLKQLTKLKRLKSMTIHGDILNAETAQILVRNFPNLEHLIIFEDPPDEVLLQY